MEEFLPLDPGSPSPGRFEVLLALPLDGRVELEMPVLTCKKN